jgi:hypothetical protein
MCQSSYLPSSRVLVLPNVSPFLLHPSSSGTISSRRQSILSVPALPQSKLSIGFAGDTVPNTACERVSQSLPSHLLGGSLCMPPDPGLVLAITAAPSGRSIRILCSGVSLTLLLQGRSSEIANCLSGGSADTAPGVDSVQNGR